MEATTSSVFLRNAETLKSASFRIYQRYHEIVFNVMVSYFNDEKLI